MQAAARDNFRYLNRDGRWAGFHWSGLELRDDGSLRLSSMPALPLPIDDAAAPGGDAEASPAPAPSAPAGIAVGADGSIYFTDPDGHRVLLVDPCAASPSPLPLPPFGGEGLANSPPRPACGERAGVRGRKRAVPCLGPNESDDLGVRSPRGLFIPRHRPDLFIADAGNGRVLVVDPATWAIVDVWGDGLLREPWAIAGDDDGALYVADRGTGRVHKFARSGDPVASFESNVHESGLVTEPAGVAVSGDTIFILDRATRTVVACDLDGHGATVVVTEGTLDAPLAIAATATGTFLYVADVGLERIVVFRRRGASAEPHEPYELVGTAPGFEGFAMALAAGANGDLLALRPDGEPPIRLIAETGFVTRGVLWSAPISIAHRPPPVWSRLRAIIARPDGAHIELFYRRWSTPAPPSSIDPDASDPFNGSGSGSGSGWIAVPRDLADTFIGGDAAAFFQVGMIFTGDSRSSAVLSQMRVSFDDDGLMAHLPELYREEGSGGDFLPRFLALLETPFLDAERKIDAAAALIDVEAAPAEALPWLASFLGLELGRGLTEADQRNTIAAAFEAYSRRGTVVGLREAIRAATGVNAIIEEPIAMTNWWAMPAASRNCGSSAAGPGGAMLGFTTVLAEANPQGAVVGATATLDQSHLIAQEEFGAPLFDSVAYQFSVLVYAGEVRCAATLDAVRAVIEREKPAHTMSHLCVIEAGSLQVGFQARLGIDTVLGGEIRPIAAGEKAGPLVLAGQPPGRLGDARIGSTTWL